MRRFLPLLGVAIALGACSASVTVTRIGRPYPSKAPSCELTFDYVDQRSMPKLLADYVEVASLELSSSEDFKWTPEVQEKLRPDACRVGGDVVAYEGHYASGQDIARRTWGLFRVYRKIDASAPPPIP